MWSVWEPFEVTLTQALNDHYLYSGLKTMLDNGPNQPQALALSKMKIIIQVRRYDQRHDNGVTTG